jgi:hypothetical protein
MMIAIYFILNISSKECTCVRAGSTVLCHGIRIYSLMQVLFATIYNLELIMKLCLIVTVYFSFEVQHVFIYNIELKYLF